jgi:hypothetical protein
MVRRSMIEVASARFAHIATNVERLDDVRYAPPRQPRLTGAGPLGRQARWRAPERLGGHERLIGPALDLAQAVFGFPDHFFDSRHCRFVMYEITKSPIAL